MERQVEAINTRGGCRAARSSPLVWTRPWAWHCWGYDRGRPVVIRGSAKTSEAVARLVEGLRRSRHLDKVALGSVTRADNKDKVTVVQFTVTGSLRGDQPLQARRSRAARSTRQQE